MSNAIWMVDGAYLMKASPVQFDYAKLKRELERALKLNFYESYFLNSTPNPPTDQQSSFHTWLKSAPPWPKNASAALQAEGVARELPRMWI